MTGVYRTIVSWPSIRNLDGLIEYDWITTFLWWLPGSKGRHLYIISHFDSRMKSCVFFSTFLLSPRSYLWLTFKKCWLLFIISLLFQSEIYNKKMQGVENFWLHFLSDVDRKICMYVPSSANSCWCCSVLLCMMKDQVWSENLLSIYDLF
jgi:hypothetical protein